MPKRKGYFLSIGCGDNQIPLLKAAKARGLKTIGVDRVSNAPGFSFCDIRIIESTKEYRKILLALSKVLMIEPLLGIATRSFGDAVFTAAYLAEKYKLVGNPPDSALLFLDKQKTKDLLLSKGIPVPSKIIPKADKKLTTKVKGHSFPIIAKPKSGSGKKGIQLLHNEKELQLLAKHNEGLIFEKYVPGPEVTLLGLVIKSIFYPVCLTDKWTSGEPPFEELAHFAPSIHLEYLGEMKMIAQAIVHATGIKNGPFLAEFKISDKRECLLIESAPEVGGEYLADQLLMEFFKYDYFLDLLSLYLGEKVEPKFQAAPKDSEVGIFFHLPKSNETTVRSKNTFVPQPNETFFMEKDFYKVGQSLPKEKGNAKRTKAIGLKRTGNIDRKGWFDSVMSRLGKEEELV